jgi:hypothetical protein
MATIYENPSAGKFNAPSHQHTAAGTPRSKQARRGWWRAGFAALGVAALLIRRSTHAEAGWLSLGAGLAVFAIGIAEFFVSRVFQEQDADGPEPYSQQTSVTR